MQRVTEHYIGYMSPYLYNDDAYIKMLARDGIGERVANMFMGL